MKPFLLLLFGTLPALAELDGPGFIIGDPEIANKEFADVTPLEFGADPKVKDKTFSLRSKILFPPVHQDGLSCVAQAIGYGLGSFVTPGSAKGELRSGDFTYRLCAGEKPPPWGEKDIIEEGKYKSRPLDPRLVFQSLRDRGTCRASLVRSWREPLSTAAIKDAANNKIPIEFAAIRGREQIKTALLELQRPLPFGIDVGREFCNPEFQGDCRHGDARVYTRISHPLPDNNGWHFMLITGWSDELNAFEVFNSYGAGFGDKGYIYIDYDLFDRQTQIVYKTSMPGDYGAPPEKSVTSEAFGQGEVDAFCKLGVRRDRGGEFVELLFDVPTEKITTGNLKQGDFLTATGQINIRSSMPVRREGGLYWPREAIGLIQPGDKVILKDFRAYMINPKGVLGTETHYWIRFRKANVPR